MSDATTKKQNWFMRHKFITGFLVLMVIGAVASAGGSSTTPTTTTETQTWQPVQEEDQPAERAPTTESVSYETVDTQVMIDAFDNNQLAAEKQYKGKNIEFNGKIKNISEDIMGGSYLSIEPLTAEEYYFGTTIKCNFKNSDDLLNASNGQETTLRGKVAEQSLGIIVVNDCQIVE